MEFKTSATLNENYLPSYLFSLKSGKIMSNRSILHPIQIFRGSFFKIYR